MQSAFQNFLVFRAHGDFRNRNHIMARFPQSPDYRTSAAFVC